MEVEMELSSGDGRWRMWEGWKLANICIDNATYYTKPLNVRGRRWGPGKMAGGSR